MPPFRLHPYLPNAVLGFAQWSTPAGPVWPGRATHTDAGAGEDAGAPA